MPIDSSQVSAHNLFTIANHLRSDPGCLKIQEIDGNQTLKVRHCFSGFFHSLLRKEDHEQRIQVLIDEHITDLSTMGREHFVKDTGEVTELFIAAHRYNQCVQNIANSKPSSLAGRLSLHIISNGNVPELSPIETIAKEKVRVVEDDQPEIVKEQRFFHTHDIRRYPGDRIDHGKEAVSIFISTQMERFLSFVGRIVEAVGRFFGYKINAFEKYHYRNKGESDEQIYSHASPMKCADTPTASGNQVEADVVSDRNAHAASPEPSSYWLGHASLLLNSPLRSASGKTASFNVITDPVQGDLNPLLYPRQTNFSRSMDALPASHVYLLSHNHLDHFDTKAIKKLVSQQPVMVVPKGDGYRYIDHGFLKVIELDWWEKQTIKFKHNGEKYVMKICATPSRHWAGQGPCGGHESTFLGYVIEGVEGGDIYFAGDTARLSEDHIGKLRDNFNIRWSFQPGGPDEVRKDMESTHQASVDALWMHFNLMVKKHYVEGMGKEEFLDSVSRLKTIYMHTMAFKLGNLHLSDTKDSVEKVIHALENEEDVENLQLEVYERQVFDELVTYASSFKFFDGETLSLKEVAAILKETVAVPKIGSRLGLTSSFMRSDLFGEFEGERICDKHT